MKPAFAYLAIPLFLAWPDFSFAQTPSQKLPDLKRPVLILAGKAYAVKNGPCGGPQGGVNGKLASFVPVDGSAETILSPNSFAEASPCFLAGLGYNYMSSRLYVVGGSSAGFTNRIYTVKPDASFVENGSFVDGSGQPFYVSELEFDEEFAYLLKNGDNKNIYRVPQQIFNGGEVKVGAPSYQLLLAPNNAPSWPIALLSGKINGKAKVWVAAQVPNGSSLQVRELKPNGTIGGPLSYHISSSNWGPITDNISGYYHDNHWYIFRVGKLYKLATSSPGEAKLTGSLEGLGAQATHDMTCIP